MQFSDTTSLTGLIQDCEFLTNIGSGKISGDTTLLKQFTVFINSHYHKAVTMILASQDEWQFDDINKTDYPIATTNLVTDQQDYTLPASLKMLRIRRVEITYDGSNWYKVEPFDIEQTGLATDTTSIRNNFSSTQPYYDIEYGAIKLYPIPSSNVTDGLKIWYIREPTEFTSASTTTEPGFDEPFHRILSVGASLDWAIARNPKLVPNLVSLYTDYEKRLKQYYGNKQQDRKYQFSSSYINYQ